MTRRLFFSASHARRVDLARRLHVPPSGSRRRLPGAWVLEPLSVAWGGASRLVAARARAAAIALDRPVLSVGGLGLGGSGKTPFVRWVAGELARKGLRAAVLTRGYGWVGPGDNPLALLPGSVAAGRQGAEPAAHSEGVEPAAHPEAPEPPSGAASSAPHAGCRPDEAQLFLRDGLAVGAHPRRAAAATALARAGVRPDVYVLDDGFQHRQLSRDWDLVLLTARELSAPRRPLPGGPFREPWEALERADTIAITGLDARSAGELAGLGARRLGLPPGPPPALAGPVWAGLEELGAWLELAARPPDQAATGGGGEALRGACVAFSGIADPSAFERLLAAQGLDLLAHVVFPDHHRYRAEELARLLSMRPAGGTLLTTEKDAARLPAGWAPAGACWIVRVELRVWRGEERLARDLACAAGQGA